VSANVRRFRSKGYLAIYLNSYITVRPVPPVLFVGRDHALILVKVGEGVICVRVRVNVMSVRSRGFLATYLTLNTCILIFMCTYMLRVCVCVYLCLCTCMCIYMCMYVPVYARTCVCMCIFVHVHVCTCMYTCMCKCMYVRICMYMHM